MTAKLYVCLASIAFTASLGCTMGQAPFDYHYGATGGSWQRSDPVNGRVGSIFAPAGDAVVQQQTAESPLQGDLEELENGDESLLAPPNGEAVDPQEPSGGEADTDKGVAPLLDDSALLEDDSQADDLELVEPEFIGAVF